MGGLEAKVQKDHFVCFTLPLLVQARLVEDFSVLKLMLVSRLVQILEVRSSSKQSGNTGHGSELICYRSIHFRGRKLPVSTPTMKSKR